MKRLFLLFCVTPLLTFSQNYGYFAGGRSAALAHSSVALTDIWSSHHNQAGLAFLEKPTSAISYENRFFLKDIGLSNAAFAYPMKQGTMGLSLSYFGFELYNESKIGLNYSRRFGQYFSMGLQLNYHSFYVAEGSQNGSVITFETGVLARPTSQLSIGFHLFNPSSSAKNDNERLPVIGRLGAQYQFSEKTALTVEARQREEVNTSYALGFEYSIIKSLTLRTGMGLEPLRNTFGLGFKLSGLDLNLSYEYAQFLGSNAVAGLQYSF